MDLQAEAFIAAFNLWKRQKGVREHAADILGRLTAVL